MAAKSPYLGGKQAEANRTAPIPVVDPIDDLTATVSFEPMLKIGNEKMILFQAHNGKFKYNQ